MVLTFKSTGVEERVLIERGRDGTQRVCRARQAEYNPKMWNLSLEHPSGQRWSGSFHGDGNSVQLAMIQLAMEKEGEYQQETNRGHRPPSQMRDPNVRVDDSGNYTVAGVRDYVRR
jgi:hypothetical protein